MEADARVCVAADAEGAETMTIPADLRAEYQRLYASCQVKPDRSTEFYGIIERIRSNAGRYANVGYLTRVPWFVIAAIHSLESSGSWSTHLHNGDPLTERTTHVPRGRPASGSPPFSWEDSAVDALTMQKLDRWRDWSLSGCLYVLERYNGMGYRKRGVPSPYLWGGSHHARPGKYVADGEWSATAESKQIGAAVILRGLEDRGLIRWLMGDEAGGEA